MASHPPIIGRPEITGLGVYTPTEAGRLIGVTPSRIARWLRGSVHEGTRYERLWAPQLDLGEHGLHLGFRDLQEVRVAAAFIGRGLSPQRVRRAIDLARTLIGDDHPLSTARFRSDGRSVFLRVEAEDGSDGEPRLFDLFAEQFAFRDVLERSLDNLDYDEGGTPSRWWPRGKAAGIVLDPRRSFGQPIDDRSGVPVEALVAAAEAEGTPERAARAWGVEPRAIEAALAFAAGLAVEHAA